MPHMPRSAAPALLIACLLGALVAPAAPVSAADTQATSTPARGQRMQAVEVAFGAPSQRYPAVGNPPISRWDYPGFVVYFENDRVVHAVRLTPAG
jgi:hypothetical protein